MSLLAIVAVAGVIAWRVGRTWLLLLPILAVVVYEAAVLLGAVGQNIQVPALTLLAEVGFAAGLSARRRRLSRN